MGKARKVALFVIAAGGLWQAKKYYFTERNDFKVNELADSYGVYSIQGLRDHMEDRYVCCPDLSSVGTKPLEKPVALFAVFDGHGGDVTSTFVSQRFPSVLYGKLMKGKYYKCKSFIHIINQSIKIRKFSGYYAKYGK